MTDNIDSEIQEVIKRLHKYGSTTCTDDLVRHFGTSDKGRDNFIRYFRDNYDTNVWLKICKGEGHTPIISIIGEWGTDKAMGYDWSVKKGVVQ